MLSDKKPAYLIAGLGNPGSSYTYTRHNIGYLALQFLAKKWALSFTKKRTAQVALKEETLLLKPAKYMNLSGNVIADYMRRYQILPEQLLVVVDDVYLPFGALRLRSKGSSGGHNGLKNIQERLETNHYSRLRIGVGSPKDSDMATYVLETFSADERKKLPEITAKAADAIELWLTQSIDYAMGKINVHPQNEGENG